MASTEDKKNSLGYFDPQPQLGIQYYQIKIEEMSLYMYLHVIRNVVKRKLSQPQLGTTSTTILNQKLKLFLQNQHLILYIVNLFRKSTHFTRCFTFLCILYFFFFFTYLTPWCIQYCKRKLCVVNDTLMFSRMQISLR